MFSITNETKDITKILDSIRILRKHELGTLKSDNSDELHKCLKKHELSKLT